VEVPQSRAHLQRRTLQVACGVRAPPLLRELRDRLLAGIELGDAFRALQRSHLRFEGPRVGRAVERLAALTLSVLPAHAEYRVALAVTSAALASVDHSWRPICSVSTSLGAPPRGLL